MSKLACVFLATLTGAAASAQEADPVAGTQAIVEAEKNFARASLERGTAAAVLDVFADDAISFNPDPVNARKFWSEHVKDPEVLAWQPAFAMSSFGGDMGFTTGPWELRKSKVDATPLNFGDYVTIWKKQADGAFKVVLDCGVTHAKARQPPGEVEQAPFDPGSAVHDPELTKRALFKAQRAFLEAARVNGSTALLAAADENVRVLRGGTFPAVGLVAAQLILTPESGKLTRTFGGSGMSASGDLAYGFGEYTQTRGELVERGYYLTIWRIDLNGDWKIVLDLQRRAPVLQLQQR